MKIKDIQIDGFGVWTGLSVDSLPEGMTLFYGPNEAGKTTLMQFVRAMLYGFTPERREKYLPPVFGGTPGGGMRVTGPGGGYEIRRHSQLTDSGQTGRLTVTGQDGLSQGQHRLSSLLGQIDEPIFTNVFAIGMRELQELSTLDDTAAADELYKLSSGLDRVSLVDVLRNLRSGRQSLVGQPSVVDNEDADKLLALIAKREKLRDEVERLTRGGRRWSELASQRRSGLQEIEQLTERVATWEHDSKVVEAATAVIDPWRRRDKILAQIEKNEAEIQLPDDAPNQLIQIDAMIEDRRRKLDTIREKRLAIREKVSQLPVSRQLFDLQGRIEAASEQATWIEALEEQIERLDGQIEQAGKQLDADAERLGLDEEDRLNLADGDWSQLPDFSKQTLSALAAPAKQVKEQVFLLKQARREGVDHKTRATKMNELMQDTLQRARSNDLPAAISEHTELIATLKNRIQVGEQLEKLKRHYRELENESVNLASSETVPLDRLLLLFVPFVLGGVATIYGLGHFFGAQWLVGDPDPNAGLVPIVLGIAGLMVFYFAWQNGQRNNSLDREDCERQIDSLRRQIREIEAERTGMDSSLPTSSESLDSRLRESQLLLSELETALPTYHNHQAAVQAYRASRKRAEDAAGELRIAKRKWAETLEDLGLSDSMSPSSVRKLSDGYESLQISRTRLEELLSEKEQRRRERQTIARRIEQLYLEAVEIHDEQTSDNADGIDDDLSVEPAAIKPKVHSTPLEQLNHLNEEITRQHHWIKRRRELKEQDQTFKRQSTNHRRHIERGEQQRRALWAKCGVATPEQFYQMVDTKAGLKQLREQHEELNQQIRSIIGNHLDYDEVAQQIDGATTTDLEKRWDSLTTRISETQTRIADLRTSMGELGQEMKHLGNDNRLSITQLELGCVERKMDSTVQRWQTLAMASNLLEDVCQTFERERQPETLREASSFLAQLTDGKYTRIWTPLGTNQLKIDDGDSKSLPLEVLSRGTREAVFIALRLSLAAAYARRGVMLPLVLDDVLVNFDHRRAVHAARTLKTFAELGHQVMMFTCHDHIVDIFHEIGVEVRIMPPQGEPGRATVLLPDESEEPYEPEEPVIEYEEEEDEEEILEIEEPEPEPEPEPVVIAAPAAAQPPEPEPEPRIIYVERPAPDPPQPKKAKPVIEPDPPAPASPAPVSTEPSIGWAWFEREPGRTIQHAHDALAAVTTDQWIDDGDRNVPDDVWNAPVNSSATGDTDSHHSRWWSEQEG